MQSKYLTIDTIASPIGRISSISPSAWGLNFTTQLFDTPAAKEFVELLENPRPYEPEEEDEDDA